MSKQTKDKAMAAMLDSIMAVGYSATSMAGLVKASGVARRSIYLHFPGGKQDLAAATIAVAGQEIETRIGMAFDHSSTPADAVDLVIGHLTENLVTSDYAKICPIAAIATGLSPEDRSLRQLASQTFEAWITRIASGLERAGHPDPHLAATRILSQIEGALMLAKAMRDTAPLAAAASAIRENLARELDNNGT